MDEITVGRNREQPHALLRGCGKAGRVGLQGVSTAVLQVNAGRPERGRPAAMMGMYGKIEVSMNRTGVPFILMKNAVDTRG